MDMNDIREEYAAEFVEKYTNEFVKGLGGRSKLISETELRDEIRKVRDHNYDPMFMEMLFAMFQVFLKKYENGVRKYREAMDLTEVELGIHDKHFDILEGMIDYLETKPKKVAKIGADARHDKPGGSRAKRQAIRDIWASGKYDTRARCAEEESRALGMSLSTAIKALANTPSPAGRC